MTAYGYRVSLWGDKNVLDLDSDDGCATLRMYCESFDYTL